MTSTPPQSNAKQNDRKPVGVLSKDGKAVDVSSDYLERISQKDRMNPRIRPLIIIAALVLAWWALIFFVYLSGAWHWLTEAWRDFVATLDL